MKKLFVILCSFAMILSMSGCSSSNKETFNGEAKGYGGNVQVEVTFDGDKIVEVKASGASETEGIGSRAIAELPAKIVEANSADVDVVSGATVTSNAIINATKQAIRAKNGNGNDISYTVGTYSASAKGYKSEVNVKVTFSENAIEDITIVSHDETYGIGHGMDTSPVEALPAKILELQGLGVDAITGATLTSNAIIAAVSDAATQAGADASILSTITPTPNPQDEVYNVDVVVVGAGSTGLAAAIEAADNGANVLLVEKQGIVGGAAARSGGKLMAAGTTYQEAQGINDDPQKMFEYLKGVGKEYIDDERLMAFCNDSLEIFNWMVEMGIKVQDVEPIHASLDTWRVHNTLGGGGMTNGHGGQITVPMYERYLTYDQGLLYNTTIDTIIMNDNNEAIGVSGVKKDGSKVTISAKSVILATGGYASNKEMVRSYDEEFPMYVTSVPTGNVGDGIVMAEAVGGQIIENPAVQTVFLNFASGVGINEEAGLILNAEGKRIANEFTYQYHVGDAIAQSHSTTGWYIATANDPSPTVQYAMTLENTLKASSIEELATLMNVDPTTLKATIDRYNELAAKGKDDDFNKPAEYLYPITGDTYYALNLLPSVTVTYSGIKTNINAEVLDVNGNPIPGLYAAGETAFPDLFGTEYPGCGMAISGGAYYGRIAGAEAANR